MAESNINPTFVLTLLLLLQLCCTVSFSTSSSITRNHTIRDGDSLISEEEIFELGFFSPKDSTLRYVGIWYKNIEPRTIVWVANREKPLLDKNGALKIADDGNLVVVNGQNDTVWSTNVPPKLNKTVALLLETGDLVLSSDSNRSNLYWESFSNPTDTYLPGMKVWVNPSRGENHAFIPWKSENDPSPGSYSLGIDPIGLLEVVIWEGDTRKWRSGPWDPALLTGRPDVFRIKNYPYRFNISSPPDPDGNVYFMYAPSNSSDLLRFRVRFDGVLEQFRWTTDATNWTLVQSNPSKECERYNRCGNNSLCDDSKDFDSGKCSCIDGFKPVYRNQWNNGDFSGGCKRIVPLSCGQGLVADREDGFKVLRGMKEPDFGSVVSLNNSETCKDVCVRDCSCYAYAIVREIGCMIWKESLVDLQYNLLNGIGLYVRLADSKHNTVRFWIVVTMVPTVSILVAVLVGLKLRKSLKRRAERKNRKARVLFQRIEALTVSGNVNGNSPINLSKLEELPPLFEFQVLATATDNFALKNKLGQGGFGPVYKGKLQERQEIAVKRLSRASGQGLEEPVNEVVVISKLQHRNLVRLLGCCIEGEEMMLVYEFMPKKSLDGYLFGPHEQHILDWKTRFNIINGICRGLMYLHRDSRLRIIHRDLKVSNILLDDNLNPKISDFGLAKIFHMNENEANTSRVVGTYGYMSPEYAMRGLFSEKSDVFSLGVILLEIVSGRKNSSFYNDDKNLNLLDYAWKLWNDGQAITLADPRIYDEAFENEMRRCVHIGLLCVQDHSNDRPCVSTVISMLGNENADFPEPKQPAFIATRNATDAESLMQRASINRVSLTSVSGR